ncbi:hypothetical protein [Streptomyces sp. NPDC059134]|uniref:hypothetical protein n=1 Tax=Streptomyces sp. NPDC059134 TaxID=3346738 RepID=UPI0036A62900
MSYRVRLQVQAQRDQAERQAQRAASDRLVTCQERDTAPEERDRERAGRHVARAERDTVRAKRHAACVECEAVGTERDAADRERELPTGYMRALEDEIRHLVTARPPAPAIFLTNRFPTVPGTLLREFAQTGPDADHPSGLEHLATLVTMERHRGNEAAQAMTRGGTTVVQAMSHQLHFRITGMREKSNAPDLAGDLLSRNKRNGQNLRHIQATGAPRGACPGLSRAASHHDDVVTGAKSRNRGCYRGKVTNHRTAPVARPRRSKPVDRERFRPMHTTGHPAGGGPLARTRPGTRSSS